MSEAYYEIPEDPSETEVELSHTKLLYYACNEILRERIGNKLIRRTDNQPHMYTDLTDQESEVFDELFVELPHTSPTEDLTHTLIVETCTKGWMSRGRFGKQVLEHTTSGYPTITLTVERSRHLVSPLGRQFGWFIMDSKVSYTCDGKDELVIRQPPEIDQTLRSLNKGKNFARDNDNELWEAINPYWENAEFNRQALKTGNFKDFQIIDEDLSEYIGPASIIEFQTLMGALSRIRTSDSEA